MSPSLSYWLMPALLALGVSLVLTLAIVRTQHWHARWSTDSTEGPQKFHKLPTPRVGGLGPFVGLCAAALWLQNTPGQAETARLLLGVIASGLLAFAAGMTEDLTKKVSVKWRLIATMGSGLLAWHLTGSLITRVDVWGVDWLLTWLPFAVAFTAFAIGGLANAINIIDGFNGLASGVVMMIFLSTGYVAHQLGDPSLATISWLMVAATMGFWLVNFPRGPIFLGDGGAYFLGFVAAWMVVILVARHPTLSPWFAFLACGYPVIETFFSIWRKTRREGHHPGQPDRVHFHMLVYARVARPLAKRWGMAQFSNAVTGVLCQIYALLPTILTLVLYSQSSWVLVAGLLLACVVYWGMYQRLTQFRWGRP